MYIFLYTTDINCISHYRLWNFVNIISLSADFNLGTPTPWGWYIITETCLNSVSTMYMYLILCIWFIPQMNTMIWNAQNRQLCNSHNMYIMIQLTHLSVSIVSHKICQGVKGSFPPSLPKSTTCVVFKIKQVSCSALQNIRTFSSTH
jgi:hypothetical protein